MTHGGALYELIRRLEEARIHLLLLKTRPGAVTILVTVPGQRWELDVFEDGTIEVERFLSQGVTSVDAALEELIADFGEPPAQEG
jgi:hypothetical protein